MSSPGPAAGSERLGRLLGGLAADQRAAATAPPGPVLCVAPAGSGKTTTLLARVAWRLAQGTPPQTICALTFNRRAAAVLRARLAPLAGLAPGAVRVRTFHALGREILADAGRPVEPLLDRSVVLRDLSVGRLGPAALRRLDDHLSRLKLEPRHGPRPAVLASYEAALAAAGGLDHDDLVAGALTLLETDLAARRHWQDRCGVLLIDEVQDLDHAQWRLARLLTARTGDLFAVGDDDQTIYAWRLADARRMLRLAAELPGLQRVDLQTNYRCPPAVVARAATLVGHNRERLAKAIRARPGATGELVLVADPGDDVARARRLLAAWAVALAHPAGLQHAILARTNAELAPYAAVAIELGLAYRGVDGLLLDAVPADLRQLPPATRLAWAARVGGAHDLAAAVAAAVARRAVLRRPDAPLLLATIHGTKGLEFDVVACVGLDDGRFPSKRGLGEAADPARALEEERRLAYVAWTRARRQLCLVYDPGAPSPFVAEAFSGRERRLADRRGTLVVPP